MLENNQGKFVLSLDFELIWGVRDHCNFDDEYATSILGVWQVFPKLLRLFEQYEIKATFATVGFLFAENKEDLLVHLPRHLPNYNDKNLSPYIEHMRFIEDEDKARFHFASNLINSLKDSEHEISTHTFSHYYCQEEGQSAVEFNDDLQAAVNIAKKNGIKLNSIVFPRNQVNNDYLTILKTHDIHIYRGLEASWIYKKQNNYLLIHLQRILRLMDSYINITGHNCYDMTYIHKNKGFINIPSSRFLRPYSKKLQSFEKLRLNRIKNSMTYAAKNNLVYHLWWHPHNFGANQDENMMFLKSIFAHYKKLNKTYNFTSCTMQSFKEHNQHA